MLDKDQTKRQAILTAAIDVFARYGFKRSSMEDIAAAAGMSRPALYQHFRNKTEIFREGSESLQHAAIDEAARIASDPRYETLASRLAAMLLAYKSAAWRIVNQTPHGREIMDLNDALAEDLTKDAIARAERVFADAIASAAAPGWNAAEASRLLTAAAWAAMIKSSEEARFKADIEALARLWAAALSRPAP